eukprot:scaffold8075_cov123-Chaetoceros_neogracile.AAC.1
MQTPYYASTAERSLVDCPKAKSADEDTKSIGGNICYKCGSYAPSLKNCGKLTTEEKQTTSKGGM